MNKRAANVVGDRNFLAAAKNREVGVNVKDVALHLIAPYSIDGLARGRHGPQREHAGPEGKHADER